MKKIKLTKGKVAIVDDIDFELLSRYKWHVSYNKGLWYAKTGKRGPLMHRLLMSPANGFIVDHVDGNGLNNVRSNLRVCTQAQNSRNRKIHKNSKSRVKGVTWREDRQKWRVRIGLDYRSIGLGHYNSKEEAVEAYKNGCQQYHKEFARY